MTIKQIIENDTQYQEIMAELDNLSALAKNHNATHNEGGEGYNPHNGKIRAAADRLHARKIEIMAANIDAVRAEWGSAVKKVATPQGVDVRDLTAMQERLGYTLADCKAARDHVVVA